GAITHADQTVHGQADGIEELTHLAVTTFGDHHAIPLVHTFATAIADRQERSRLAFDFNARQQLVARVFGQRTQHAHSVLALHAERWVHQLVGQLARVREQQQAFGVQIKATDRHPLAIVQTWQTTEHGWTALWIVVGHHFACWLVVRQDTGSRRRNADLDRAACHLDAIAMRNTLADVCDLVVHFDAAVFDHLLDVTA